MSKFDYNKTIQHACGERKCPIQKRAKNELGKVCVHFEIVNLYFIIVGDANKVEELCNGMFIFVIVVNISNKTCCYCIRKKRKQIKANDQLFNGVSPECKSC